MKKTLSFKELVGRVEQATKQMDPLYQQINSLKVEAFQELSRVAVGLRIDAHSDASIKAAIEHPECHRGVKQKLVALRDRILELAEEVQQIYAKLKPLQEDLEARLKVLVPAHHKRLQETSSALIEAIVLALKHYTEDAQEARHLARQTQAVKQSFYAESSFRMRSTPLGQAKALLEYEAKTRTTVTELPEPAASEETLASDALTRS